MNPGAISSIAEVWTRPGLDRRVALPDHHWQVPPCPTTPADILDGYVRGALAGKELTLARTARSGAAPRRLWRLVARRDAGPGDQPRRTMRSASPGGDYAPIRAEPWDPQVRMPRAARSFANVMTFGGPAAGHALLRGRHPQFRVRRNVVPPGARPALASLDHAGGRGRILHATCRSARTSMPPWRAAMPGRRNAGVRPAIRHPRRLAQGLVHPGRGARNGQAGGRRAAVRQLTHIEEQQSAMAQIKRHEGQGRAGHRRGIGPRPRHARSSWPGPARMSASSTSTPPGWRTRAGLLAASGVDVLVHAADLAEPDNCRAAVEAAVARFGRLDALCNIAGDHIPGNIRTRCRGRTMAQDHRDESQSAPFFLSQAAIPHLLRANGAIVNVASSAAFIGEAYAAAYCATKAGLVNLTKAMAMEYMQQPIRINAVAPGGMITNIVANINLPKDCDFELLRRYSGMRGVVEVDDVARAGRLSRLAMPRAATTAPASRSTQASRRGDGTWPMDSSASSAWAARAARWPNALLDGRLPLAVWARRAEVLEPFLATRRNGSRQAWRSSARSRYWSVSAWSTMPACGRCATPADTRHAPGQSSSRSTPRSRPAAASRSPRNAPRAAFP